MNTWIGLKVLITTGSMKMQVLDQYYISTLINYFLVFARLELKLTYRKFFELVFVEDLTNFYQLFANTSQVIKICDKWGWNNSVKVTPYFSQRFLAALGCLLKPIFHSEFNKIAKLQICSTVIHW